MKSYWIVIQLDDEDDSTSESVKGQIIEHLSHATTFGNISVEFCMPLAAMPKADCEFKQEFRQEKPEAGGKEG